MHLLNKAYVIFGYGFEVNLQTFLNYFIQYHDRTLELDETMDINEYCQEYIDRYIPGNPFVYCNEDSNIPHYEQTIFICHRSCTEISLDNINSKHISFETLNLDVDEREIMNILSEKMNTTCSFKLYSY